MVAQENGTRFYTSDAAPIALLAATTLTGYRLQGPKFHRDRDQRPFYYLEDLIAWRDRTKGERSDAHPQDVDDVGRSQPVGLTPRELLIYDMLRGQLSDAQRQERQS